MKANNQQPAEPDWYEISGEWRKHFEEVSAELRRLKTQEPLTCGPIQQLTATVTTSEQPAETTQGKGLTVQQVQDIYRIIGRWSSDVIDYEGATDDINAYLFGGIEQPESKAAASLQLRVKELTAAAELTVQHFKRNQVSGNFQGDDEHECWTALEAALRGDKVEKGAGQ